MLDIIKEYSPENFQNIKNDTYNELNHIIQSSAAVECVNSILRPYLNTMKNNVTQDFFNLFQFYHNHRRFDAGLRKGKTPFEIASGTNEQSDWLDLVMQKVA